MKTALVTGGYKGLGLAWCRELGENGYEVILTARDGQKAMDTAESLKKEGFVVHPAKLDVTAESEIIDLAEWVAGRFGKVDLIINNAGVNPKDFSDPQKKAAAFTLSQLDPATMLEVIHVNSLAPLIVVKHFRSLLHNSKKPMVINISSWLGSVQELSFGGHYGYVGSKNLLNILNKSMAYELKDEGILCLNVNPGWVKTDMGGSKAIFTPGEAVHNIYLNIIEKAELSWTGAFLNFDGKVHPW